jgi:hypothetical protein
MIDLALLLLLGAAGAAVLWPYWQFARGGFRTVSVEARIVLRQVQTLEARKPLFVLRGEVLAGSLGQRTFSVFPWHSDNVFASVEAAQQAARLAGFRDEVLQSLVLVRGISGTHVHATAWMSPSAYRQLKIWSGVACAVPVLIMLAWFQNQ